MLTTRILVVDDDPDLRGLLQERLTDRGYRVETADNGHDALTKLDQAVFDGVLLDDLMSGITGVAVLQHIRQHCPLLPVVMMTGETSSQVAAQARAAGARACLRKPFDPGTLEQVVQICFGTAAYVWLSRTTRNGTEGNATRAHWWIIVSQPVYDTRTDRSGRRAI